MLNSSTLRFQQSQYRLQMVIQTSGVSNAASQSPISIRMAPLRMFPNNIPLPVGFCRRHSKQSSYRGGVREVTHHAKYNFNPCIHLFSVPLIKEITNPLVRANVKDVTRSHIDLHVWIVGNTLLNVVDRFVELAFVQT